ncbi:asparagine synthase (glutamine-hydrolyzing) [Anaeropeptidivorans aminofermentans]|uniref:asparagine synthase (glutamine-hydrolyzing) n=1 Tax=Anaeropeptidivorans aminofermentans TaxID=2934315 RepID=UPI00202445AD|nr:asparagine synthase (glutamine-hydrolyzing) [Anaeropeptidivorans aminofermentans]MBE6012907.1 asparagine synthase (glutamine-hydrolyzing) [Lachnospiraceae bacterium]
MCGLCGFTRHEKEDFHGSALNNMMDKIIHRGPDSEGTYEGENIMLGFRRLSIIDLDEGSQPIYNEDRTKVIVFNGEIYNYQSLRAEMIEKDHVFSTNSDTEVLIHLYEEYGTGLLNHIRGMFAFAIYDMEKDELFCARDFFGIKPFYYALCNGELVFASEIKSILEYPGIKKEVNTLALENYLTFQYSVLEETFFKGIYKLMPSHYLIFKENQLEKIRYFQPEFTPDKALSLTEAIDAIDKGVEESIKMHKISDVEVGSFLSSGVDSSYVAACFKGDKTFTVGFDYDNYNEIEYAKSLSEKVGIENYSKTITTEEFWDVLPKVQYQMDEPLADAAAIALYFVSQMASQHVKVALSGEGADEFFGGYNIYKEPIDLKILTDLPMPIRRLLGKIASKIPFKIKGKNFFIRGSKTVEERFIGNANVFSKSEREAILKDPAGKFDPMEITGPLYEKIKNYDDITKMQYIDIHLWLIGDILLKADKMSMAHSLEVRVPYLDKEIFKIASKIPVNYRVNKTATKYAFRMAAKRHLPEDVANKKKLGFPVPIRIWLKEDKYYHIVKAEFESENAELFFNKEKLSALLDGHRAGKADNSRKIWTVFMFLIWYRAYFN